MSGHLTIRQSVRNLSPEDLGKFRKAMGEIQAIDDNRGFRAIAGIHGVPEFQCWHHQFQRGNPVSVRLFLPWHRAYMLAVEQALQDRDPDVGLPWWNWASAVSRSEGIPQAYADETLADGSGNPLFKFHIREPSAGLDEDTHRDPGDPAELPFPGVPDAVARLTAITDWSDFSDIIQDVHDFTHGWVGGSMGVVPTSAFDPIFFAHHCQIDRIWYLWQNEHGDSGIPNELLNVVLSPFPQKVADVLNIKNLGYEYAASQVSVPGVS